MACFITILTGHDEYHGKPIYTEYELNTDVSVAFLSNTAFFETKTEVFKIPTRNIEKIRFCDFSGTCHIVSRDELGYYDEIVNTCKPINVHAFIDYDTEEYSVQVPTEYVTEIYFE